VGRGVWSTPFRLGITNTRSPRWRPPPLSVTKAGGDQVPASSRTLRMPRARMPIVALPLTWFGPWPRARVPCSGIGEDEHRFGRLENRARDGVGGRRHVRQRGRRVIDPLGLRTGSPGTCACVTDRSQCASGSDTRIINTPTRRIHAGKWLRMCAPFPEILPI
jgi:hypothetical protein